jgi:hypothetical protein
VEVLRLLRSGICEMDVRAGWARMAKRSGRGMQVEQPLCLCGCMGKDQDQELQPHLLLSKSGGLHTGPVSIIVPPCGILAWDMGLRRLRGIYFESTSRADATVETKPAAKSLPACLGLGDPEIQ